jgi:hypothetical protein
VFFGGFVTRHLDPTLRHRAVTTTLRAGSAVTTALPGHAGSGVIDRLERILQQDAAPRRPNRCSTTRASIAGERSQPLPAPTAS